MPLTQIDLAAEEYAKNLSKVLSELEAKVYDVLGKAKTGRDMFDAATLRDSRGEILQALRDSGYHKLANEHVAKYTGIVDAVKSDFGKRGLPPAKFSTVTAETFQSISQTDLEKFRVLGTKAMDDMRFELYRHAISSRPFSDMVNTIRAATVGVDGKGSPLGNYSYTHANTAILDFSKAAVRLAGEEIGADKWEVVGPDDDATRKECHDALQKPVRTKEEWNNVGYWGEGERYNCRHTLYPYFGD